MPACPSSLLSHRRAVPTTLLSQAKPRNNTAIPLYVAVSDILEQCRPRPDHFQEPATRRMVFPVCFEVFGQFIDTGRQYSNLNLRRPRISLPPLVVLDNLTFFFLRQHRQKLPFTNTFGIFHASTTLFGPFLSLAIRYYINIESDCKLFIKNNLRACAPKDCSCWAPAVYQPATNRSAKLARLRPAAKPVA